MNDHDMKHYVALMKQVALTDKERDRLLQACRAVTDKPDMLAERVRPSANAERVVTFQSARPRRGKRIFAISSVAAAVLLGMVLFAHPNPNSANDAASTPGTLSASRLPSFALVAYADGLPVKGRENTVLAAGDFLNQTSGWSVNEVEDENGEIVKGVQAVRTAFTIDLSSIGEGIRGLRYSIDGDEGIVLEYLASRNGADTDGALQDRTGKTLSFDADDLAAAGTVDGGTFSVSLTFAMSDELQELSDCADSDEATWSRFEAALYDQAAELLDGRVITIEATFQDGSTLAHRYRLEPVDGFGTALANSMRAYRELTDEELEAYAAPALFTIEQLD